jgi:hypothetical protein
VAAVPPRYRRQAMPGPPRSDTRDGFALSIHQANFLFRGPEQPDPWRPREVRRTERGLGRRATRFFRRTERARPSRVRLSRLYPSASENIRLSVRETAEGFRFMSRLRVRASDLRYQASKHGPILAIISFVLGLYRGIVGTVPVWLLAAALLLLVAVVWVSGIVRQTRRGIRDLYEWY